ncbi:hypothetical protein ON010_g11171 [Phytophthora cinnamomi]|nr:hypothetical protein ON010_g11171 [Phytophthora cinnamomi]
MLAPSAARAREFLAPRHRFSIDRRPAAATAIRSFSSSSDSENWPKFVHGPNFIRGLWNRTVPRLPKLLEWQEKNVFADSLGTTGQCWQFIQLQQPQKTSVDLLEFVEGARIATEEYLWAMNSAAFAEFLAGKENSSSDMANVLQQYSTPAYYNEIALQVKKSYLQRNFHMECEGLVVENARLTRVVYRRLTEKEYEDLVAFKKPPKAMSLEATIEHLRLHVDVQTVENLNIVHRDKTVYVQQENVYQVVFESRVTDPEDIDWRIESMNIVEQDAVEREPKEATKDDKTE